MLTTFQMTSSFFVGPILNPRIRTMKNLTKTPAEARVGLEREAFGTLAGGSTHAGLGG